MTQRRLILVLALMATIAVAGYLAFWLTAPPGPRINEEIVAKMGGMSQAQVEALMGRPSDVKGCWAWKDGNTVVGVEFNESGKVSGVDFGVMQDNSIVAKIRRWLRL